tara:strand:+ start:825 stop:2024 length:1200 start_codon:yes stop_codon:yes gene_type:complete
MYNIILTFSKLVLLLGLFFACQNEESIIGENIVINSNNEVFLYPDSLKKIEIYSAIEDSLQSQSSIGLLGSYVDPISGLTNASFSFQITLPNNEMEFDANNVNFSKLTLPVSDFFGDSLSILNIRISRLNEPLGTDDNSFFTSSVINSELINGANYSISLSEVLDSNKLEIDLPQNFGLEEILNLDSQSLSNNENFTNAFYGFQIDVEPANQNGAIVYFDCSSDIAELEINYINNNNETISTFFPIGPGIKINNVSHNYDEESIYTSEYFFVQSMGGVYTEIDFKFLNDLQDSLFIVNKATLEVPVHNQNNGFPLPPQISLVEYFENNLIPIEGINGGILINNERYEFDLTQHFQKIISNNHNSVCRIYSYNRSSNVSRLQISNSSSNPIKLTLILIRG